MKLEQKACVSQANSRFSLLSPSTIPLAKICLAGLIAMSGHASAQTAIDPEVEITETIDVDKYADYILNGENYDVNNDYSVRTFKATVSGADTAYIPLGTFSHGSYHRLTVNTGGPDAGSSAEYTFSVNYTNNLAQDGISVHQVLQKDNGSHFKIYEIRDGYKTALVMKYTNTAQAGSSNGDNPIVINHTTPFETSAVAWSPISSETLLTNFLALSDEAKEEFVLKGAIELHTGANVATNGFIEGLQFNQPVNVEQGLNVDGATVLKGDVIIETPQGDVSMGEFQ